MTERRLVCPACDAEILIDPPLLDAGHLNEILELEAFRPGLGGEMLELFSISAESIIEECRSASRRNDRRGLALAAHRLKGSAASLGAARLKSLANRLERDAYEGKAPSITGERLDELSSLLDETVAAFQAWLAA